MGFTKKLIYNTCLQLYITIIMKYQDTIQTIDAVFRRHGIQTDYNNKICGYIIRTQKVLAYLLFTLDDKNEIVLDFDVIQGNEEDLNFYKEILIMLKPTLSGKKRKIDELL